MSESVRPGDLVMRWVEVCDERGRTRLESRWVVVSETTVPAHANAA